MVNFTVWIITRDRKISDSWRNLFSRERFQTVQLADFSGVNQSPESWGLVFAEICADGLSGPKDLKAFLSGRKNVSVLVFCEAGKADNALISEFLEKGADDFILKDIDERVLLSKAKAHIRRLLPNLNSGKTLIVSKNGDIEIDQLKRTVKTGFGSKKEKVLENLTPKEFEIFSTFLCMEGEVVSRNMLMETVWKEKSGDVNCETIDKHVETLRKKLGTYGKSIRTIYGSGYTYKSEDGAGGQRTVKR